VGGRGGAGCGVDGSPQARKSNQAKSVARLIKKVQAIFPRVVTHFEISGHRYEQPGAHAQGLVRAAGEGVAVTWFDVPAEAAVLPGLGHEFRRRLDP
jgi:hypothetical protein